MKELLVCPIPNFIWGDKMSIINKLVFYVEQVFQASEGVQSKGPKPLKIKSSWISTYQ